MQFAFTTSLEMKLLWLSKWCPIGVNLVSMDRGHIGLHCNWRDLKVNGQFLSYSSVFSSVQVCKNPHIRPFSESSRVTVLEPSRSFGVFSGFI